MGTSSFAGEMTVTFEIDGLDPDKHAIEQVEIHEAIGEMFSVELTILPGAFELRGWEEFLGYEAALHVGFEGEIVRHFYGEIVGVQRTFGILSNEPDVRIRLCIAPRAARLAMVQVPEVHLDMTIPEIFQLKLNGVGLEAEDFDFSKLRRDYEKRDHVTQLNETDLAFIRRWCEHLGISFYFTFDDGVEKIVFIDDPSGYASVNDQYDLALGSHGFISEPTLDRQSMPESFAVMDYDYRNPNLELTSTHASRAGQVGMLTEYGGHFRTTEAGAALAQVRAEERECSSRVYAGQTCEVALSAGHTIQLSESTATTMSAGGGLLIVSVHHILRGGNPTNTFKAVQGTQAYRLPRRTPKPNIPGLLSAVIEPVEHGKTEDPACIDDKGRYWIKFMFDTSALTQTKASKPVRMALPSAGPAYGIHFPLRPGVEVAIAFMNGDPDRPVIVGALHNYRELPHVVTANEQINSIETASGIKMHFKDTLQRR